MDRASVKNPGDAGAKPVISLARGDGRVCLVCAEPADELICGACRARIQGEALERKREQERGAPR